MMMSDQHSPKTTDPAATRRQKTGRSINWNEIVACSPLALVVLDAETFAIRSMSPAFHTLSGVPMDDLLDRPFPDLLPLASTEQIRSALRTLQEAGAPNRDVEVSYLHPERGLVFWICTIWPFLAGDGGTDCLSVHVSEVRHQSPELSEFSLLADQLRTANEQLLLAGVRQLELAEQGRHHAQQIDDLLVSLAGGVVVVDGKGQIVLANAPARLMLGLPDPADPCFADRFQQLDLLYADGSAVPALERPIQRVLRGEQFSNLELTLLRANAEPVRIDFNGSAIKDGDSGTVTLAILVLYEVTAKRRLDDLRADYIALISHDLRSPLSAVLGYVELVRIALKTNNEGQASDWMTRIQEAAHRMAAMIEDLVESSRLESGLLKLRLEPADFAELTRQAVANLPSQHDRRRIQIEAPAHPLRRSMDHRFERVVTNLVSNALKYSPPDAPVAVRILENDDDLILTVTDLGPGLPPESIPKLFQRFYRVEPGSRVEGMGLGLYIARLIVEAHRGRIWVDSEAGKGTTFSVSLPLE